MAGKSEGQQFDRGQSSRLDLGPLTAMLSLLKLPIDLAPVARWLRRQLRKPFERMPRWPRLTVGPCEDFAAKLERLLAQRQGPLRGSVHIINLKYLQVDFPERWPKIERRLIGVAEGVLRRRLAATDSYLRDGYCLLVLFAELTPEAANAKAALLAAEIERRLFGDDFDYRKPRIRASVFNLRRNEMEALSPADLLLRMGEALHRLGARRAWLALDELKPAAQPLSGAGASANAEGAAQSTPWATCRSALARNPIWQLMAGLSAAFPIWHPISRQSLLERDQPWMPIPAEPPIDANLIDCAYRPVWNVRMRAISTYHCAPFWKDSGLPCVVASEGRPRTALEVDLKILEWLAANALHQQGKPVVVSCPTHFHTLTDPSARDAFSRGCQSRLGDSTRLMVCEIVNIPRGVTEFALRDALAAASRHFRHTMLQWPLEWLDFTMLRGIRVARVGVQLRPTAVREEKLIGQLALASCAKAAQLRTYVHGLPTLSLTQAAVAVGFDFVDGIPVSSISDGPSPMQRYPREDLFAPPLNRTGHRSPQATPRERKYRRSGRAGAKVLVIDNDRMLRQSIAKMLRHAGHQVVKANNGVEALARPDLDTVDIVVTDVAQATNGIETITTLRERHPSIKVVATGDGSHCAEVLRLAARVGAYRTLTKSFGTRDLIFAVEACLEDAH